MALDPSIWNMANRPTTALETPEEAKMRALGIQNALGQQQLQQAQIAGAGLENQRSQNQLDATQALNETMRGAYKPQADGSLGIDKNAIVTSLAQKGQGSQIPSVLQHLNEAEKVGVDLKDSKGKLATQQADYGGSIGAATRAAGYDPAVFLASAKHAVDIGAIDPQTAQQLTQQIQQNPGSVKAIADQLIAASPKQRQLDAAATTAEARQQQADQTGAHYKATEKMDADKAARQAKVDEFNQAVKAQELKQGAQRIGLEGSRLNLEKQTQAGGGLALSKDGLDMAAEAYSKTGQLPPMGMGKAGAGVRTAIINRAAELHPGSDLAGNKADYAANTSSLKKIQQQSDTIDAFESTASKNIDNFLKIGKQIQDSGIPILNTPIRKLNAKVMGQANYGAFEAQRQTAAAETAKILASANATGTLSDSARKEAETLFDQNATFAQWQSAANALKQDFANRKQANLDQIQAIHTRMGGHAAPAAGAATHRFNPATGKIEAIQ